MTEHKRDLTYAERGIAIIQVSADLWETISYLSGSPTPIRLR
jgi:hypothetical protein